ncbi:MAG: hypothetical protein KDE26_12390 [Bacteroidetes bacterium]|nr:hypothetical protein [Bacteroidota bacterium]MCB0844046.1 hypothetical protein [Bacteroidota bacterium]
MNRYAYIVFVVALATVSCNQPPPPVERVSVPIDSLYQLDLPSNLQPGYDMHDYASLQYYDTVMDFYLLGIEDAKQNLGEIKRKRLKLRGYYEFVETAVLENAETYYKVADQEVSLSDKLKVKSGDYYFKNKQGSGKYDLFYRIAVFENDDYFFQMVFWLPYENHCEQMTWIDTITNSFTFIDDKTGADIGVR